MESDEPVHLLGPGRRVSLVAIEDGLGAGPFRGRKSFDSLQDETLFVAEDLPLDGRKIEMLPDDDPVHVEEDTPDRGPSRCTIQSRHAPTPP